MIKKFIDKLFGKSDGSASDAKAVKKSPFGTRSDIQVKDHGINPKLVDERAMDVVLTLKEAGFHIGLLTARAWHQNGKAIIHIRKRFWDFGNRFN